VANAALLLPQGRYGHRPSAFYLRLGAWRAARSANAEYLAVLANSAENVLRAPRTACLQRAMLDLNAFGEGRHAAALASRGRLRGGAQTAAIERRMNLHRYGVW
jgi:hypothetical protein